MSSQECLNIQQLDQELEDAKAALASLNRRHIARQIELETKILTLASKKTNVQAFALPQVNDERVCPDLY